LIGERSQVRWRLGSRIEVELTEAMPLTGGLVFKALSEPDAPDPNAPRPRLGIRSRISTPRPKFPGGGKSKGPKQPGFRDEKPPRHGVKNMKKKKR
jgi:ribonuclease R